jgi:hypothetical protein
MKHHYFSAPSLILSALITMLSLVASPTGHAGRLTTNDLAYLGAFRLPGNETPPQTFAYGGNAMTFNPDGDPGNQDAHPGSLFIMGHDRIAYGTLPNGNQVAEISIPEPVISRNLADLPEARFLQNFQDVLAPYFHDLDEIPRVGLTYLNHPATGPKIHVSWGQHLQFENAASQGWFNPTLIYPDFQGRWFIGNQPPYSVSGYLFEIPAAWADAYAQGRYLATGRMRDGGQGGMGPALFAYRPWQDDGSAPPPGTRLTEIPLLLYENAYNTDQIVRAMHGYQHPDEWEGGAWITTTSGQSAVLFAGAKSTGTKYWYGYINARGAEYPCVDRYATDFTACRMANGNACPAEDFIPCCDADLGNCASGRGWWSTRFDAQFILFDPADLARVAAGEWESWQPQPYASLDIDPHLYLNAPPWDDVGEGDQRRYRIGDVAYDRAHDLLYVLEYLADGGKPVVHVWRVGGATTPATSLLTNISTRGWVGTEDNVMIGGFILRGSAAKRVLITAKGPALADANVPSVLNDPALTLYDGSGQPILDNDNWGSSLNAAEIQAHPAGPRYPREAAILTTLNPGAYTAIVRGVDAATGNALVEIYEVR